MITISKESLLYRFLINYHSKYDIPNNLCAFVRKVLFTLFFCIVGWGLITFLVASLPVTIVGLFLGMSLDDLGPFGAGFVLDILAILIIAFMLGKEYAEKKYYASSYYNNPSPKKASKPWLITEYYRAVKNKICPMLEFTNPVTAGDNVKE